MRIALFVVAALFSLSCKHSSDESASPSDAEDDFEACGGDVVGLWTLDENHTLQTMTQGECVTVVDETDWDMGTLELTEDGNYVARWEGYGYERRTTIGEACMRTCATGRPEDSCHTDDGNNCICDASGDAVMVFERSGQYTLSGTTIIMDGGPTDYCVEGDTMRAGYTTSAGSGDLHIEVIVRGTYTRVE